MRKLSFWAKQNPWKARIIISVSHILLLALAWFTGTLLTAMELEPPAWFSFFFALVCLIAVFAYPSLKNKSSYKTIPLYVRQKTCDFLLALSIFGMVTGLTASSENVFPFFPQTYGSATAIIKPKEKPTANEILASLKYRDKNTLTHQEKRILKAELKKQLKVYVVSKISGKKDESGDAVLIILTIIAAVGLTLLISALACSIMCNGAEALGFVVLILGVAAIVWGTIAIIRSINRKSKKDLPKKENIGS